MDSANTAEVIYYEGEYPEEETLTQQNMIVFDPENETLTSLWAKIKLIYTQKNCLHTKKGNPLTEAEVKTIIKNILKKYFSNPSELLGADIKTVSPQLMEFGLKLNFPELTNERNFLKALSRALVVYHSDLMKQFQKMIEDGGVALEVKEILTSH